MDWIRDHSAINRLCFQASTVPKYTPDSDKLWYLEESRYTIASSLILANGNFGTVTDRISGEYPILLFCHGTGSNVGSCYRFGRRLAKAVGCHVILFDYPGYGLSKGGPANGTLACASVETMINHLVQTMRVAPDRLILMGHSLGTSIAVHGAAHCCKYYGSVRSMILMNPFLTLRAAARDICFIGGGIMERLPTTKMIGHCHCPILIVHGQKDRIVPVTHGYQLYNSLSEPKEGWFPEDATHDKLDLDQFHLVLTTFLNRIPFEIGPDYSNVTPRTEPIRTFPCPSAFTPIIATIGEVAIVPFVDGYRPCFFL